MPVSQTSGEIRLELGSVLLEERHEILRADLLLALDQDRDVDRQRTRDLLPGPAGLHKGHQLALVVLGAARDDDLASIGVIGDHGFERRTMPEIERIDRLHIVVAVEQHMRPRILAAVGLTSSSPASSSLGDNRRMAGGRPDLGGKAERRDILGQMIGRFLAIVGEGRIGRDRLDPQKRKQPLQAIVEIGIDAVENRL
jgi:hypothetical protein